MAPNFRPGKGAVALFNNANMSPILQDVTIEASAAALDATAHGNNDEVFIAGMRGGMASFDGLFDGTAISTASTATTGALDSKFASALASTTQPIITVGPEGDTLGYRCRMFKAETVQYVAQSPAMDIVRANAAVQISDRQDYGVWLHALASRSSTSSTYGNVDSVDAGTTGGGVGHLHVTSASVASMVVKIQHSSAASTGSTDAWADIITFSSVTESSAAATAVQRSTVSGTVKRRTRAIVSTFSTASGNSTTATFAVAFARRNAIR